MQKEIRIGIACMARKTYDFEAALEIYRKTVLDLHRIPNVHWSVIETLVIEPADAYGAAEILAREQLDGLVLVTGTFHLGHLAMILKKKVNIPTLLWAFPELPYNGGKIRLNSV